MNLPISLYVALRYWRTKSADRFGRLVANLASFGIVLGVMALIIVLSVMNGLEGYQKQQVLSSIPHAIISQEAPISAEKPLENTPHFVQKAVPINTTNVVFQTAKGVSAGKVIGIQSFSDDPLLEDIDPSQFNQLLPQGEFKLIIGDNLAQKLGLAVGDKVRLMITENSQYTPFGRVPMQRLFTVSEIYYDYGEASGYEVFANLADIGRLMRIQPGEAQGYRLFLDDPFQITELPNYFKESHISDWRVQKGEFFQAVRMEKNMMGLLLSLIVAVAAFNIITSLGLMVMEKQGEVAILQTQGLTPRQIMMVFMVQGASAGIIGAILGAALGALLASQLNNLMPIIGVLLDGAALPVAIEPLQVIVIALVAMAIALLSTLYPSWRAAATQPAEALRYE